MLVQDEVRVQNKTVEGKEALIQKETPVYKGFPACKDANKPLLRCILRQLYDKEDEMVLFKRCFYVQTEAPVQRAAPVENEALFHKTQAYKENKLLSTSVCPPTAVRWGWRDHGVGSPGGKNTARGFCWGLVGGEGGGWAAGKNGEGAAGQGMWEGDA